MSAGEARALLQRRRERLRRGGLLPGRTHPLPWTIALRHRTNHIRSNLGSTVEETVLPGQGGLSPQGDAMTSGALSRSRIKEEAGSVGPTTCL